MENWQAAEKYGLTWKFWFFAETPCEQKHSKIAKKAIRQKKKQFIKKKLVIPKQKSIKRNFDKKQEK